MKIADPTPPHCASCYQAKNDERHVDFGASYDGPVIPSDNGEVAGAGAVAIDDLIVCETCLTEAGKLLDLVNAESLIAENKGLEEHNERLADRVLELEAHAKRLEETLSQRPAPMERLPA